MNCKHVQELLPLYVGRDLEEKSAQLVTAHVQSCAECAGSAAEYRETRQLVQQFAPPPFSNEVYDGIRQRVWREIGRESTAPTMVQLVASLFRPRLRWALASALLLAVSVFAFYFVTNRSHRDERAGGGGKVEGSRLPKVKEREVVPPAGAIRDKEPGRELARDTHPRRRRTSPRTAPDRTGSVAVNTPHPPSAAAEASPIANNLAEPTAITPGNPATSEKAMRVEMQTKDQNIRIIWFSHPRTKQVAPVESFKGI